MRNNKLWIALWVFIFTISILGLIVPFAAQFLLPAFVEDYNPAGAEVWNIFVSIILGLVATTLSIVSLALCVYSERKAVESERRAVEAEKTAAHFNKITKESLDKIEILLSDVKKEQKNIRQDMLKSISKKVIYKDDENPPDNENIEEEV